MMGRYVPGARPNVRPNVRPNDRTYDRTYDGTTERTTERPKRTTERPKAYDRATVIRTAERTCECADVRPTKNAHSVFYSEKPVVSGFFSIFLVGHSMKKLALTTTVRSECRLSYRTSLHKSMCLAPQRSGLSHFDPS